MLIFYIYLVVWRQNIPNLRAFGAGVGPVQGWRNRGDRSPGPHKFYLLGGTEGTRYL